METKISTSPSQAAPSVDYAAALRHFQHYHRGRSMRRYCEEEGYDYNKFCKHAREALNAPSGEPAVFVEVPADVQSEKPIASASSSPSLSVREIRIRLSNGVDLTSRNSDPQEIISLLTKMLS